VLTLVGRFGRCLLERLRELLFRLLLGGGDRGLELGFASALGLLDVRFERRFTRVALGELGVAARAIARELGRQEIDVALQLLGLAPEVLGALGGLVLVVLGRVLAL